MIRRMLLDVLKRLNQGLPCEGARDRRAHKDGLIQGLKRNPMIKSLPMGVRERGYQMILKCFWWKTLDVEVISRWGVTMAMLESMIL